jgi:hypothetical protein
LVDSTLAIYPDMTVEQVKENCAGPLNKAGYDLLHDGTCYKVTAYRHSPKNPDTCKVTSRIKPGYDVLLAIIYAEDFSIRALYRLTPEEAVAGVRSPSQH